MMNILMMILGKKLNSFRKIKKFNKYKNKKFHNLKYHNHNLNYLVIHTNLYLNYLNKKKIKIKNILNKAKTKRMVTFIRIITK